MANPAGTTLTAVPVGRNTGGTHLVQSVQSAHVVGWPRPIRAALSVHHHTDDSSTAHVFVASAASVVVGALSDIKRQTNGVSLTFGFRVDSGREAGGESMV